MIVEIKAPTHSGSFIKGQLAFVADAGRAPRAFVRCGASRSRARTIPRGSQLNAGACRRRWSRGPRNEQPADARLTAALGLVRFPICPVLGWLLRVGVGRLPRVNASQFLYYSTNLILVLIR